MRRRVQAVKQVACGQSHILALTESGDVYAFGNGSMMQLGHGAKTCGRRRLGLDTICKAVATLGTFEYLGSCCEGRMSTRWQPVAITPWLLRVSASAPW